MATVAGAVGSEFVRSSGTGSMISIQDLCRSYGSVVAVDGFSVEIGSGEIVGLLGHNGAGKTTVMKILTGFLDASEGSVHVGGVDVGTDPIGVKRQIGYLPENAPLYPEMLVQEYLGMMAELRGVATDQVDAAVAEAAVAVGVHGHLVSPISALSKGYRQRVGLAQAIVHRPAVLVLDEPTNGLDPVQIQTIRQLIRDLASRATIILSTHILQEIEAVCDRVLIMIEGRLVSDSSLADLLVSDLVRLTLRGDPQGVESRLGAVDGVRSVAPALSRSSVGETTWTVQCAAAGLVPAIIEAANGAGWEIAAIGPEERTLETVFQNLQEVRAVQLQADEQGDEGHSQ